MEKRNKILLGILLILAFLPKYTFAQQTLREQLTIEYAESAIDKRNFAWAIDLMNTEQLHERKDSVFYHFDRYYNQCVKENEKSVANCERCALASLDIWSLKIDTVYKKAYKAAVKSNEYKRDLIQVSEDWEKFKVAAAKQRLFLATRVELNTENIILLYQQELIMYHYYYDFLYELTVGQY